MIKQNNQMINNFSKKFDFVNDIKNHLKYFANMLLLKKQNNARKIEFY